MSTNNGNGTKLNYSRNGAGGHQLPDLIATLGVIDVYPVPRVAREKVQGQTLKDSDPSPVTFKRSPRTFDSPAILQQSPHIVRAILWGLMGITTVALVWANVAKIEEAIPATGKLEPLGRVKQVQAPVAGVVKEIYVEDGQRVNQGDRLLSLDATTAKSQLASLQKIRTTLIQENQFVQAQIGSNRPTSLLEPEMVQQKLPLELISLTKDRATLVAENQLYRAILNSGERFYLTPEQQERLQSHQAELNSRVVAAQLEVAQLKAQLSQTEIKLATTKGTLTMNQGILQNISQLKQVGAISQIQYLKQQEEVRQSQSEAEQLSQEQARLKLAINEAIAKVNAIFALDRKELLTLIADNDKRLAEIDSQLTKQMVENNQHLAETSSQISQAQMTLKYQELDAPSAGTVFDLQAHNPGFVASASQPLLKIVPDDALTAKVFITNRDIGFVKAGMKVDVRIDSFPFSEFGDIKGQLVWIGSDALPPDSIHPYYRFPAKIRLERQSLLVQGRPLPLQAGMSVSANIKVRSRTVMSIFTDLFAKNVDGLKFIH